jgi:hypothetical protein
VIFSDLILLITRAFIRFHKVFSNDDNDLVVTNKMKIIYKNTNFKCTQKAFICTLHYYHLNEWLDEEFSKDIIQFSKDECIAIVLFPIMQDFFVHNNADGYEKLAEDLLSTAEELFTSPDENVHAVVDSFIQTLTNEEFYIS